MKRILSTLTALTLSLAPLAADAGENSPSWLFVQTSSGLTLDGNTLTIPYEREVFAFTDRPDRKHVYLNAHQFEALWDDQRNDNFTVNPPNAVLTWVSTDGVHEAEIELSSAAVKNFGRALAYEIKPLAGDQIPQGANLVSLFIDDEESIGDEFLHGVWEGTKMIGEQALEAGEVATEM